MIAVEHGTPSGQIVYWHGELPPISADAVGEHSLEATSHRIPAGLAHRDDLWDNCQNDLIATARVRLEQEVARLGGKYARVIEESIDAQHDYVSDEVWLQGRFKYVLYR